MSDTDRIRERLAEARRIAGDRAPVTVKGPVAEALCDIADAARARHSKQGCMTCDFDDPCAIADALARLDVEDVLS